MTSISRARTGCWTCRARRIKCDEARPKCRRCARLNVDCGYGVRLIWHEESMARGVCHGREAVWSKWDTLNRNKWTRGQISRQNAGSATAEQISRNTNRDWVFLNTSSHDLELYLNLPHDTDMPPSTSLSFLTRPLTTIPTKARYLDDPALLSFFERIICSSSTLVDNAHCNPYRYLILPMAMSSTGLYHATLAIAANTLRLSNPSYRVPALEHHSRSLAHLRFLLSQDEWTERELDEMIGLVLMLCWFEISDNSCPAWITHLNGCQDLLHTRQCRPARSAHSEQLGNFFNRYFAFHHVLARTAFRLDSSSSALQLPLVPAGTENTAADDPDVIDTYMGLSPSLLVLINQVAEIAWSDPAHSPTSSEHILLLERQLENLHQVPPLGDGMIDETECIAIAEANRLGALLLLHEVDSTVAASGTTKATTTSRHEGKNRCVERILALILEKRANMMRTAVLPLWPLFLAGCCAPSDAERVIVMRLFGELEGIHRFGNIAPAMQVVQMVWRQRDLAAQDDRKRQKNNGTRQARFEWERAMTMLGNWKLSLT
ncbi:fungal-specific transcription factor domain-containing protein [Aspergillus pseudodeflectus]|uniref:Fungal-specific transcription factor domain-containing protein n=1 Tax=Aspergillus pseudodeflectus TaxID=176178 RepID=A0ABR4KD28_9EURO